jgi:hypothetical protein
MTTERLGTYIRRCFRAALPLLGVEASPVFVSKHFLWFTAFVGANLFQSGFTRLCPLESLLRRFGVKTAGSVS